MNRDGPKSIYFSCGSPTRRTLWAWPRKHGPTNSIKSFKNQNNHTKYNAGKKVERKAGFLFRHNKAFKLRPLSSRETIAVKFGWRQYQPLDVQCNPLHYPLEKLLRPGCVVYPTVVLCVFRKRGGFSAQQVDAVSISVLLYLDFGFCNL